MAFKEREWASCPLISITADVTRAIGHSNRIEFFPALCVITDTHGLFSSIRSRVQALFYYKPVFSVVISSTRGDDLAQTKPTGRIDISKDTY